MNTFYHRITYSRGLLILLFLAPFFSGCKTSFPAFETDQTFQRSNIAKDSVVQLIHRAYPKESIFPFYAKGKLNVSQKDRSERGTVEIHAYSDSLYARIKNQVGIAGMEVWKINERLIIRDRVDQKTHRYTQKTVPDPLIRSLVQLPLERILTPGVELRSTDIRRIEQSTDFYRIKLQHQRYLLIDRHSGQILRIDDPNYWQFPFQRIEYQLYRPFGQGHLARRIRIFQPNEQTDIFLLLQELRPLTDNQTQWPSDPPSNHPK